MKKITLFHGTPDKIVVPTYGKGQEKHDYGRHQAQKCHVQIGL